LGANFQEFIGIIKYQPLKKLYINARLIYYYKGLDSGSINFGGDIFRDYTTRSSGEGFKVAGGEKLSVLNALLEVSYELKQNLYFEFTFQQRNSKLAGATKTVNSTFISGGVRINMFKRTYDY
jgi:hypothetical protein